MGSEAWNHLVAAALLGTERQPLNLPPIQGALAQVITSLGDRSPEAQLLITAATLALHQQAGQLPETRPLCATAALLDNRPPCSPQATRLLQRLLQGEQPELLLEWLELATATGQGIPELYLPELLEKGRQQPAQRPAIAPLLGQRGTWLASQNPDWSYAAAVATAADWETGAPAARLLYLQGVRSQTPDQARELLQSTWKQEAASDRAKFLEVLALNLSLEDEPFLEAALDDRSQPVKRAAAKLLNKLPASRRGQRMAERVRSLVQIQRQGTGYTITVELPPTCDAAMQRDGIEVKAPGSKGDRAWWLEQLLIAAPLETWEKPDVDHIQALWAATEGHDWQSLIQSSWNLAILYQRQVTWAKALLTHHLTPGWHNGLFSLLGLLPPAEQVELVLQALHDPQRRVNHLLEVLLIATSIKNWPLELGQRTLDILIELLPNLGDARYGMVRQLLPHLARCLPPELLPAAAQLPQVAEQIPQSVRNYYLPQDLQAFLLTLEFRRDLHQAFSS